MQFAPRYTAVKPTRKDKNISHFSARNTNQMEVENLNPNVYKKCEDRKISASDEDDNMVDPFDEREIFGEQTKIKSPLSDP